jgi:hypothetical protein
LIGKYYFWVFGELAFKWNVVVHLIANGEGEEECGGGGFGASRRAEGREGTGSEAVGGGAESKRAQGGGGALVEEKELKKVIAYA